MKLIKTERGQSLVELGISLLILLLLLSGAAEFGVLFFQYVQLRDAAQEGALYGSMNPLKTQWADIETRARAASDSPVDLTDTSKVEVSIFVTDKDSGLRTLVWKDGVAKVVSSSVTCEGHGIEVLVHYDHKMFMPFIPQILDLPNNSIPLNATVTDTILAPICPPPP